VGVHAATPPCSRTTWKGDGGERTSKHVGRRGNPEKPLNPPVCDGNIARPHAAASFFERHKTVPGLIFEIVFQTGGGISRKDRGRAVNPSSCITSALEIQIISHEFSLIREDS
jgi:hypothetical protein